ncbi:CRISPR-associated helicase Cas3' [Dehalococcoidia bacterium]|nr:CRISPR-associated helicase Cas3' [Dehalococcoidia bacterium]
MMSTLSHSEEEIFSHPDVTLRTHLEEVGKAAREFALGTPLNLPFPQEALVKAAQLMGLYHDMGKATTFFQDYLSESNSQRKAILKNQPETRHSLISAVAAYFATQIGLSSYDMAPDWREFLPVAVFVSVRHHHGNLEPLLDDTGLGEVAVLQNQTQHLPPRYLSFLPHWEDVSSQLKALPRSWSLGKFKLLPWLQQDRGLLPYLLQNFLFSLLLDADKHITALGQTIPRPPVAPDLVDHYRAIKGFDHAATPINQLRNAIYDETLASLDSILLSGNKILSLTAPTGAGKTLTVLSLALRLRETIRIHTGHTSRIIYTLPFLSIIDQNAQVFHDVFEQVQGQPPTSDLLLAHHHLSELSFTTRENEYDIGESEILVEGWNSEIVITTFVQFFHALFSNRNRSLRKFHNIVGSIVILDEIQSFPPKYWLLFRETAEILAKRFNTYFILTTATQPAIFENCTELLPRKKEFFHRLNRTQIHVHLSPSQHLSDLGELVIDKLKHDNKDTLIVLNTIRTARELYEDLKAPLDDLGFEIYFLSSHLVPRERLRRIQAIKMCKYPKVVVSTQLIEAGVDLDFEWVIRDLGPLDTVNQVAGRTNRNSLRETGQLDLIMLVDGSGHRFCSYIYDGLLLSVTCEVIGNKELVCEPQFLQLVEDYFRRVRGRLSDDRSRELLQYLHNMNYEQVGKFRLIDESGEKVDIFVELDDEAESVWQAFCDAKKIADRWERRQAIRALRGKFSPYVLSVTASQALQNLPPELEGMRYVPRGQLESWYDPETGFKVESTEGARMF